MPTTTPYPMHIGDLFREVRTVELVVVECTCGILFGIPKRLKESALAHRGPKGWSITCPLGHSWHYTGDDEIVRVKKERDREREYSARLRAELDQTEASLRATKGVVTKLKKRASAGVCPCCNRSFQNVARHMATKHPDFAEQNTNSSQDDAT